METDTQQLNMEGKNWQTESYNTQMQRHIHTPRQAVADMKYTGAN